MRYVARTIAMMALSSTALAQQASDPVEHPPYAPELRMELAMLAPGALAGALRTLPSLIWTVSHPETWDRKHRSYMDFYHDSDARGSGEPPMVEHAAPGSPPLRAVVGEEDPAEAWPRRPAAAGCAAAGCGEAPTPMDVHPLAADLLVPAFADEQDFVPGDGIIAVETHETFSSVPGAYR